MHTWLVLAVGALSVGGAVASEDLVSVFDNYQSSPIHDIETRVLPRSKEHLEEMLSEYSVHHGYKLRVAVIDPRQPAYSIMLWRRDSLIFGTNPEEVNVFVFAVYAALSNGISSDEAMRVAAALEAELVAE